MARKLGKWDFEPKSGKLQPPQVGKQMRPLGVAHLKFWTESKMPQKWVIAANGE